jgi:hypothetical protein
MYVPATSFGGLGVVTRTCARMLYGRACGTCVGVLFLRHNVLFIFFSL